MPLFLVAAYLYNIYVYYTAELCPVPVKRTPVTLVRRLQLWRGAPMSLRVKVTMTAISQPQ